MLSPAKPLLALFCLSLTLRPARAEAPSQADLLTRLIAAHNASNLDDPTLRPWHMLASFDLLDPKGAVKEHGTFEEWWLSPDHWHQRFTSPSFSDEVFRSVDAVSGTSSGRMPYLLTILKSQLLNPVPLHAPEDQPSITAQTQSFGKVKLDCLITRSAKQTAPAIFGASPTFCLEPQQAELRFFMEQQVQQVSRNRPGRFQNKAVALSITVEEAGHPVLRATIDQLQGGSVTDADVAPPSGMTVHPVTPHLSSGVMQALKLGGASPHYPAAAKTEHITGTVLLSATIGTDGRINNLEPIWSPDSSLTAASLEAVRTWTYKPYLLNGQPVEVDTTIAVHFNMTR